MTGYPIFLLASERSGTNLLRRRMSERQGSVVGPPPLHFLKHLFHASPFYGDFDDDRVFGEFIEDALGLAYNHFSPWDELIDPEEVVEKYPDYFSPRRSAIGVMHVLYTIYAERKGYASYFCKDNNLFDFACEIASEIPEAQFVYLYRDPRDVVLSQKGRFTQNRSAGYLAQLWRDEQIKCIRCWRSLTGSDRILSISYEALIEDEDRQLSRLCSKFGLESSGSGSIDFDRERTDTVEWANLSKPTMKDNSKKYRSQLSNRAISRIESIAWHQMQWLGYSPERSKRPKVNRLIVEIEARLGAISRLLRGKFGRKRLSKGQITRLAYTRDLARKWK